MAANVHSLLLPGRDLATDTERRRVRRWCCNVPVGHTEDRCHLPRLPAGKQAHAVGIFKVVLGRCVSEAICLHMYIYSDRPSLSAVAFSVWGVGEENQVQVIDIGS